MKWFIMALQKYAQFNVRSTRQEFWMFFLFYVLFGLASQLIDKLLYNVIHFQFVNVIFSLAMFIPNLAITVRRLHDINKSAWWLLLYLMPFVGLGFTAALYLASDMVSSIVYFVIALSFIIFIWFIVLLAKKGTPGPNQYGQDSNNGSNWDDESLDSHLV